MQRTGNNIKLGALLLVVSFAVFAVAFYGGAKLVEEEKAPATPESADTGPITPGGPVTIDLVAKDLKFDKRSLAASSGGAVTVNFTNQDAGILHNVAFYTSRSATQKIFVGQIITGVNSITEKFTAPAAGNYFFRCDVHPDMNGAFVVK